MRKMSVLSGIVMLLWVVIVPATAQVGLDIYGTVQRFERGLMLWRSDTAMIWVLADNQQAFQFAASDYTSLRDNPIFGTPPSRLRPIFGFGKVWGNNRQIRDLIGWPVRGEIGYPMSIRQYRGPSYLVVFNQSAYQISADGTWEAAAEPIGRPEIIGFGIDRTSAAPGDTVTLFWQTWGVDLVMIELYDTGRNIQTAFIPDFAPNGEAVFPIPTNMTGDAHFVIWGTRKPFPNAIPPEYERLTSSELTLSIQRDVEAEMIVEAAYEKFERGFMIWRSDNNTIYIFSNLNGDSGGQVNTYPERAYIALTDNLSIFVPSLYSRPVNGFGLVWSNYPEVRDQLGYATASEYGFSLIVREDDGMPTRFDLPDGSRATVAYPEALWRFS